MQTTRNAIQSSRILVKVELPKVCSGIVVGLHTDKLNASRQRRGQISAAVNLARSGASRGVRNYFEDGTDNHIGSQFSVTVREISIVRPNR